MLIIPSKLNLSWADEKLSAARFSIIQTIGVKTSFGSIPKDSAAGAETRPTRPTVRTKIITKGISGKTKTLESNEITEKVPNVKAINGAVISWAENDSSMMEGMMPALFL